MFRRFFIFLACAAIFCPAMALTAAADGNTPPPWTNDNALLVSVDPDDRAAVLGDPENAFPEIHPTAVYIRNLNAGGGSSCELLAVLPGSGADAQQEAIDALSADPKVLSARKCEETPFESINTLQLAASAQTVKVGETVSLKPQGEAHIYYPPSGGLCIQVIPVGFDPDKTYAPLDFPQMKVDDVEQVFPDSLYLSIASSDYYDLVRAVDTLARSPDIQSVWLDLTAPTGIRPENYCTVSDPSVAYFTNVTQDIYDPDHIVGTADENGDYVLQGLKPGTVTVIYVTIGYQYGVIAATADITVTAGMAGDVNDDGVVNTTDARMVLQTAVDKITLTAGQALRADVSGDGKADTTDARMILQYCVGKLEQLTGAK